jgi:hypothetical protein
VLFIGTLSVAASTLTLIKYKGTELIKTVHLIWLITRRVGRVAQSVYRLATGWTIRRSNPGGGEIFRIYPDRP